MAAAKIKMAALTKKARFRAIVESMKLYFKACLIPSFDRSNFRVCTSEECKYKLCGITVAPMIPMAMYKAVSLGIVGINPSITLSNSGWAKNISNTKETPITKTKAMIKASIFRIPLLIKNSNRKVSKTVIITPSINGISNSKLIPIAIPKTSARSQAAMAISARKYKI